MNILNFLNSQSVAKYLEEINYKFSAQEAAFIVWNSNKPFAEKVTAWQEIIKTMQDCTVRCRFDYPKYPSLHKFLKNYMLLVEHIGEDADEHSLQEDEFYIYTAFEFMWFATPAPFKKGDIVYNSTDKEPQPLVITDLSFWNKENLKKQNQRDYSDMSAHGYILRDGNLDYDWQWNYLDFEYLNQSLKDESRALLALSDQLKGKIYK